MDKLVEVNVDENCELRLSVNWTKLSRQRSEFHEVQEIDVNQNSEVQNVAGSSVAELGLHSGSSGCQAVGCVAASCGAQRRDGN